MRTPSGALVAVLAIVATIVSGCTSAPRSTVPTPSMGAAWGEAVVPLDREIEVTGGFEVAAPATEDEGDSEPSADFTVGPTTVVTVTFAYRNSGVDPQTPRIRLLGEVGGGTVFAFADQTTIDVHFADHTETLSQKEAEAWWSPDGLLLPAVAHGESITIGYSAVTVSEACEAPSNTLTFRVTETNGDRNEVAATITVRAEECPPPTDDAEL